MASIGPSGARGGSMSLDQLIALNDEIVALTRAGMPLGRGLMETSRDLPGRLKGITAAVAERIDRGESLSEALAGLGSQVPPVYRAVVDAGVRSGRISTALEGIAGYARGYAEARRSIGLALWYPMIVVSFAYALFVFLLQFIIPKFEAVLRDFGVPMHPAFVWLARSSGWVAEFWWVGPLLLLAVAAAWAWSGRSAGLGQGGRSGFGLLRWFPWFGRMMRSYEAAGYAELLALLVDNGVTYPEALRLSGRASGDPKLAASSETLAEAVERGESTAVAARSARALPPLLRWVMSTGEAQGNLAGSLREMARRYQADARDQAEKIRTLLPTILLCLIGATATLAYALALFYPMSMLWNGLALPTH